MGARRIKFREIKYNWRLYFLVLPAVVGALLFAYFPAVSGVYHSFFRWNGADLKFFVGLDNFTRALADPELGHGFKIIGIFVLMNLFKMIPSMITAVCIHRLKSERSQYIYRVLFVVPMIIPGMVYLLIWKFFYNPTVGLLNRFLDWSGLMHLLAWIDGIFNWGVFAVGQNPAWLGDKLLVIPSLILWGFPWVGVVGVLIYLSGLQNISQSVYDAGTIDGVGWFRKFSKIEFPLIMTQVRLNLIMMIIGTLQDYGLVLILLGATGGPEGVALVPGLLMYRQAFLQLFVGYACAIGLLLFAVIIILTIISNKFVRVEK